MLEKKEFEIPSEKFKKGATVYTDSDTPVKAAIIYFHGGGLLYGRRKDLPRPHLNTLTQAGYAIIAFDYPLAPAAKLEMIMNDVESSIQYYIDHSDELIKNPKSSEGSLPYFLWGRSAGAYLCLIAAAKGTYTQAPAGILSYYGYGFLCDNWFKEPSRHYCTLPKVPESALCVIPEGIHADGDLDTHYSVYVYASQQGNWIDLFYEGREKFFYLDYTLRACDKLPCPLFCAHSTGDTDVPFSEFTELSNKYHAKRFIVSGTEHDFDRDTENPFTQKVLDETVAFIEKCLNK